MIGEWWLVIGTKIKFQFEEYLIVTHDAPVDTIFLSATSSLSIISIKSIDIEALSWIMMIK